MKCKECGSQNIYLHPTRDNIYVCSLCGTEFHKLDLIFNIDK